MRSLFLLAGIMVLVVGVFAFIAAPGIGAAPDTPPPDLTCHLAVVDGDESEWDLANDYVTDLLHQGSLGNDTVGKLYMRSDPATQTAYVLVLMETGYVLDLSLSGEHWVKVATPPSSTFIKMVDDTSGNNGTPPDFAFIYDGPDAVGWEASFTLAEGDNYNIDVHTLYDDDETARVQIGGFEVSINCLGTIGDYVWYDEDGEGDQDEDPNTHGLNNITVRLLKVSAGNVIELVDTETTNPVGFYLFKDVKPGNYIVDVHDPDITSAFNPDGWISTTNNDPYPTPAGNTISLSQGENHLDADFGYDTLGDLVALGDWVWYDKFPPAGSQDEGPEYGIPCVTVTMYDLNDNYLGQTNTDSWGYYYFAGMEASPLFYTVVDQNDEDINNFIEAFNGSGSATCNLVTEDWPDGSTAGALMAPMNTNPTTGTTADTTELDVPGRTDLKLDFAFNDPTAISLASFEVAEASAAPANWALVAVLAAFLGTGAWLLRRRKQEVN